MFTRLARGEGKPPAEGQLRADGPWREAAFARHRLRRHLVLIAAVLLALLRAVVILGLM